MKMSQFIKINRAKALILLTDNYNVQNLFLSLIIIGGSSLINHYKIEPDDVCVLLFQIFQKHAKLLYLA